MRRLTAFLLLLVLGSCLAIADDKHPRSTPQERARMVEVAAKLRTEPLDPAYRPDREWALRWLIEIPDITISLCSATMPWETKYKYAGDLMSVEMTSAAAYIIQHPEEKNEAVIGQAGLEAALEAYQKILASDPGAKSKKMNEVLAIQAKGELSNYIKQQWSKMCK